VRDEEEDMIVRLARFFLLWLGWRSCGGLRGGDWEEDGGEFV
jgi:hypothetical protein